tara:strand:- start:53 stop:1405 length:1353 start_codon:yes stop_codon:yes gene_type:complete
MFGFKKYLVELTVSPDYQSKGVFNPFYVLNIPEDDIRPSVGDGEIKYKSVDVGSGTLIKRYGKGNFHFQVNVNGEDTNFYIITPKKGFVTAHYGQKTRKSATASSNVNEFLTVYFLLHKDYTDAKTFMSDIGGKTGPTGVLDGAGKSVTYEDLIELIDKDETAERDIQIGYKNSVVVAKDLPNTIDKVFWVPAIKPDGVGSKNPSDVVIKLIDGTYVGYSNKISAGKDATPKINTNITAFYSKLGDKRQLKSIQNMIDDAWNDAASTIEVTTPNAHKAISTFSISGEGFSESSSKRAFATLARAFQKDKLKFYADDFYYKFRNNLISAFSTYISDSRNMVYLLNTVGFYTYDDPNATPCPYKLLIGSEKGSTIKEVSSDEKQRQIFFTKKPSDLTQIRTSYDNKSQSFALSFGYRPLGKIISAPITLRTRAAGGWSGKSLYVTTSGFKVK